MENNGRFDLVDPDSLQQLPVEKVPIDTLVNAGSPRRGGEKASHIHALAESEGDLPPIIVHRQTMKIIDGMHRYHAAQLRGEVEVQVRFFDGDENSAFMLAVRANVTHGLPLSLADRRAAAVRIIQWHPEWSDRMIAVVTGLSSKTVASMRSRPSGGCSQLDARIGRDGKIRPLDSLKRRKIAAELMAAKPDASLREIAAQAGISPETARAVRNSLLQDTRPDDTAEGIQKAALMKQKEPAAPARLSAARSMVESLSNDPSFRSIEKGRALLRMMIALQLVCDEMDEFVEIIPLHCLNRVAKIATECSEVWKVLAARAQKRESEEM